MVYGSHIWAISLFVRLYFFQLLMKASDLVQSPEKIGGGLPVSLSPWVPAGCCPGTPPLPPPPPPPPLPLPPLCYVQAERSTRLEQEGYDRVAWLVVNGASASGTQWEHLDCGNKGDTWWRGRRSYPRRTRWFRGNLQVLRNMAWLTQELRLKVWVRYWYRLYTTVGYRKESSGTTD